MKIVYISPENVGAAWPMFKDYAHNVFPMTKKRRTPAKFLKDLMDDRESLMLVQDNDGSIVGFMTTSVSEYDDTKMLQVRMLSGDRFDEWIDMAQNTLDQIAMDNDCDGMELIGRRGWIRKLARLGWEEAYVTAEKRFAHV